MLFRNFKITLFFVNYFRFFFFLLLIYSLLVDVNVNFLICSFLKSFFFSFNIYTILIVNILLIISLFILLSIKINRKSNIINLFIIELYLRVIYFKKLFNISYILYFLKLIKYTHIYIYEIFIKRFLFINIIKNIITYQFNWYPLYRKLSYYGYFKISRNNNALDYEKNIFLIKN